MKKMILVGYSGHAFVVADAAICMGLKLHYYSEVSKVNTNPFNLNYIGFEGNKDFEGWADDYEFILGIGDNKLRQKIGKQIVNKNKLLKTVIHPTASISKNVNIGEGSFVSKNVSVNPLAIIGNFCILNTGCIVEHECILGEAVHVAPGAVLAGNVSVGERTFIGANVVVKQGIKIGKDVIIGAGSVVIKNIPDGKKIVGNPTREI
ncbi:sugar O-acyltransferase, sialic acid O-acetyltransferase NeuD family [Halpernia humi]|uniref:Sugar O-acyltransferase, sialic acid O-acetyltransferase NeuD family n=1 Tax=Halpernia humi TaxID=493375 RepID=A0A1H6A2L5_9FLAO|nr:acetyltransferase [Halpernia humi]SEG42969.1 sugar O-acyltransferase, sialic acid O-acetyltransferase NeuD family [Halpernia humi]